MNEQDTLNKLSEKIIGFAFKIHQKLGPGFTEKIYEEAFVYELKKNKIDFIRQGLIKVKYDNIYLGEQRLDFIVENSIILELKSTSEIQDIHKDQLFSYLKTINKKLGLILNFAKNSLEIKRIVNKF